MKIVLVNTQFFPGGGPATYHFNLAELLRHNGHTVSFFAMQDPRNLPDPNDDLFVSNIDFRELNQHRSLASGLRVASRAIYSREAREKFRQLLDRVQPDIVQLRGIHGHLTPSVIFEAQARGLPVIWGLPDYKLLCPNSAFVVDRTGQICEACGAHDYFQPILKRCKKDSLMASAMASLEAYVHLWLGVRDRVDAFLAPSRFCRDKLLERGFEANRVHYLPKFLPDDQRPAVVTPAQGYLLFIGRLEMLKGIFPLLEACRLAPEVRLILAGGADAAMRQNLPALLPPNAEYVGQQQGDALRQLVGNATAVVVPSLSYENQPFSILEAFGMHKPAITSDLGSMTELVVDHERGLLVPPGEAQALAEAMRWLTAHPAEARDMGEAAFRYVSREHSASVHYDQLMDLYTRCLAGKGARGTSVARPQSGQN